jgi:hypothetical protein
MLVGTLCDNEWIVLSKMPEKFHADCSTWTNQQCSHWLSTMFVDEFVVALSYCRRLRVPGLLICPINNSVIRPYMWAPPPHTHTPPLLTAPPTAPLPTLATAPNSPAYRPPPAHSPLFALRDSVYADLTSSTVLFQTSLHTRSSSTHIFVNSRYHHIPHISSCIVVLFHAMFHRSLHIHNWLYHTYIYVL